MLNGTEIIPHLNSEKYKTYLKPPESNPQSQREGAAEASKESVKNAC